MLKLLLAGGAVTLVGLTGYLPVSAQTELPANQSQEQPVSEQQEDVSAEELQQFANVITQLPAIEEKAQLAILQAVQDEGLSPQEYQEMLVAQQNPDAQAAPETTADQKESFERAFNQVSEIQETAKEEMQQAVEAEGLELTRFSELSAAIQQDPALQQQLQQILQN